MKEPKTEQFLRTYAYKFSYSNLVKWAEIDIKTSEDNPARLHRKLDELRVELYGCEMLDGTDFPAIVLLRQAVGGYLVATGLHRMKAALLAKKEGIDAYIVTEEDIYRAELLIRLLNRIEGVGDTKKDQIRHALEMHKRHPRHSLTELAKEFRLKADEVHRAAHHDAGLQRAHLAGYNFDDKPQATVVALNAIQNDHVFIRACAYVYSFQTKAIEIEEIVRKLKTLRTESDQLALLQKEYEAAEEVRRQAKARGRRTPSSKATKLIGRARSFNTMMAFGVPALQLSSLTDIAGARVTLMDLIENAKLAISDLDRIMILQAAA